MHFVKELNVTKTSKKPVSLSFETLCERANPSSAYVDGGGNIVIDGTESRDVVELVYKPAQSSTYYSIPARYQVVENGVVTASINSYWVTGDRIYFHGKGGDDYMDNKVSWMRLFAYGGHGNDHLRGHHQADELWGGAGNDTLEGFGGNDVLVASNNDVNDMDNGSNVNFLHGGGGNDTLWGHYGTNYLYGNSGSDMLYGGANNDYLYGQSDWDVLSGGNGNDWLDGGLDGIMDRLIGGGDYDTFVVEQNVEWYWWYDQADDMWLQKSRTVYSEEMVDFNPYYDRMIPH